MDVGLVALLAGLGAYFGLSAIPEDVKRAALGAGVLIGAAVMLAQALS